MSSEDLQRFIEDLNADEALAKEFGALGDDPEAWHRHATEKGYQLTVEETGALSSSHRELSDHDLEAVAGGWDGSGSGSGTESTGGD